MDLPDLVCHKIVQVLSGNGVLQLQALAGISKQWRSIVSSSHYKSLSMESDLKFLTEQKNTSFRGDALSDRFLRSSLERKTAFFISVAGLLQNHGAMHCCGAAITDRVILELARGSADSFCIEDSPHVTDASLTILIASHPHMRHLCLRNLKRVQGTFMTTLLRVAQQLETLELHELPAMSWSPTIFCPDTLPTLHSMTLHDVGLPGHPHRDLFHHFPGVRKLNVNCQPLSVWAAATHCKLLEEVVLETSSPSATEECLAGLLTIPRLAVLELRPREFLLTRQHMTLVGMMDLCELRLHSRLFSQQPLNRLGYTHIDDAGVKALVDSICSRSLQQQTGNQHDFKLSLCGASAISQDAVSALLRLPLLSGLQLDGCHRISSIDRMRLIAKVKVGREMVDAKRRSKLKQLNSAMDRHA